ncbi:MAG: endonuclease III [Pseudomonadota bacterium]
MRVNQMNDTRSRCDKIRKKLKAVYPGVKTQLDHSSPFQLLAATILSAQCTDRQVNQTTPGLFDAYPTAGAMSRAPVADIERLIHATGFYRNKAKNLSNCARALMDRHRGLVPDTMDALVKLPGVGRKTANVVLGAAFGIPGMVVDTHVARISRRLGLTAHTDPVHIERDLMAVVPRRDWSDFSLRLVYFGREYCRARSPRCPECPVTRWCPWEGKTADDR